jgi:PBP1b-binding outer membrane lipoprotein LpoB
MKMVMRVAAVLALALLAAWCAFPGRLLFKRWRIEKNYKSAGYTMQPGCNGAWANQSMFKLYSLSNDLEEVQQSTIPDTNELLRIQREIIAAQKERAFRDEDCRQRGHVDTIPVKLLTNSPPR